MKEGNPILIAYRGDHTVAKIERHGNAKHKDSFIPSLPSLKEHLAIKCKGKKPIKTLFKDLKVKARKKMKVLHKLKNAGAPFIPRDRKQLSNYRARSKSHHIISPCELTSLHLLATHHLNEFIRLYMSIPEFHCVMAHPKAIELSNRLLKAAGENPNLEQVLCYDTTFDLGEFYLSSLVMKNTELKGDKIFPVAFFFAQS